MKFKFLSLLVIGTALLFSTVNAAETEKVLPAAEAKAHVGETVTVTGQVDGIKVLGSGMILINVDGKYPNQALTVVVREADAAAVGDVSGYEGKKIRVHGTVTEFKGGAQIEIKTKEAIAEAK
jgi:DNA/RNA endonuclease YhcR with UshA esterase domain